MVDSDIEEENPLIEQEENESKSSKNYLYLTALEDEKKINKNLSKFE
jgi:hypothetical protein